MPRLTLRTLLAYIDDTLEPTEARSLGKKVAASDDAKELVERIKRVTRRRALATPEATNGDDETGDPNTVAEYLDNTLDSATLTQVEETCLTSDVHLAEVAACHQILTLVLTEPVRVPPRAHRRMYGLVPAPASLPNRRPNRTLPISGAAPPLDSRAEADDADAALLLGMKRYSAATTWAARLALFGAAAVLLVLLTGAALLSLQQQTHKPPETAAGHSSSLGVPAPLPPTVPVDGKPKEKEPVLVPMPPPMGDVPLPKVVDVNRAAEMAAEAAIAIALTAADLAGKLPVEPMPPQVGRVDPPSPKRAAIARVARTVGEHVLIVTEREPGNWTRLQLKPDDEDPIFATDTVMALPGYKANVLAGDRGKQVEVRLWGNVPEQIQYRVLESRVKFHVPPDGFDADITLLGGRIYLKSKQAAGSKVRVRLASEVWDLTLPDSEASVLVELISWFEPGTPYALKGGAKPKQEGRVGVVFGSAAFACAPRFKKFDKVGKDAQILWDSSTNTLSDPPRAIENAQESEKDPVLVGEFHTQLKKVLTNMADAVTEPNGTRAVVTRLLDPANNVQFRDLVARLAVYSQIAMAEGPDAPILLKPLVDELGKKDPWYTRQAVVTALVNWLPRDPGNTAILHAVLVEKGGLATEADLVVAMLRGFISPTQPKEEPLDQLLSSLGESSTRLSSPSVGVWVREVALWNLLAVDQSRWVPALVLDKAWISGAEVKSPEYQAYLKGWAERIALIKKRAPVPLPKK